VPAIMCLAREVVHESRAIVNRTYLYCGGTGAGREEIQMGARENGATYSADLTMDCTHLIAQISSHLS
jgi:hypothetical protein